MAPATRSTPRPSAVQRSTRRPLPPLPEPSALAALLALSALLALRRRARPPVGPSSGGPPSASDARLPTAPSAAQSGASGGSPLFAKPPAFQPSRCGSGSWRCPSPRTPLCGIRQSPRVRSGALGARCKHRPRWSRCTYRLHRGGCRRVPCWAPVGVPCRVARRVTSRRCSCHLH
ncbi:PEP-CTERM sorting domain-containing protein [Streptomyces noursei]|uniref:PEP-CTERM sorting domain-containing protein n=1 Tax=Streptomyces noursei TaxID=1971 RepID=UPI0038303CAE